MFFNKYFNLMFSAIVLIAVLHATALARFYYWEIWWFDIMMHFLGGLWVVFAVFWFNGWKKLPFNLNFIRTLVVVLIVGVLWEIWELAFGLTFVTKAGYFSDTISDLFFDLIGAMFVYKLISLKKRDVEQTQN